jgi:hypothetical protein
MNKKEGGSGSDIAGIKFLSHNLKTGRKKILHLTSTHAQPEGRPDFASTGNIRKSDCSFWI